MAQENIDSEGRRGVKLRRLSHCYCFERFGISPLSLKIKCTNKVIDDLNLPDFHPLFLLVSDVGVVRSDLFHELTQDILGKLIFKIAVASPVVKALTGVRILEGKAVEVARLFPASNLEILFSFLTLAASSAPNSAMPAPRPVLPFHHGNHCLRYGGADISLSSEGKIPAETGCTLGNSTRWRLAPNP